MKAFFVFVGITCFMPILNFVLAHIMMVCRPSMNFDQASDTGWVLEFLIFFVTTLAVTIGSSYND